MVQSNVNRELANLGADLTRNYMNEGFETWSILKNNSPIHGAGENNLLTLQTVLNDGNEEALAGAAATASLLSPHTNNSASVNLNQSWVRMKFYLYHHKQNHFLDYSDDSTLDHAVIYTSDISFQYNEKEGRYIEFIGNPTGTIFVATKRDHEFVLNQRRNTHNISNNSNNFRQLCVDLSFCCIIKQLVDSLEQNIGCWRQAFIQPTAGLHQVWGRTPQAGSTSSQAVKTNLPQASSAGSQPGRNTGKAGGQS